MAENKLILIKTDGSTVENPEIDGLTVNYWGEGNLIKIDEGCRFQNCKFMLSHSSEIIIRETHARGLKNTVVNMSGNGACKKLYLAKGTSIESCYFSMQSEPGLKITIGEDCMFSTNIIFRATDGHAIFDLNTKKLLNRSREIRIGNHCWIGGGVTILKGTTVPDNCVIGAESLLTGEYEKENSILAGCPAKVIRTDIGWSRDHIADYQEPQQPPRV